MVRSGEFNDEQLFQLVQAGDQRGLTWLLERHGGRVAGYLQRRFVQLDEAEIHDALVEAVLRLCETYDPQRGNLGSWLLYLAQRQAVTQVRRRRRRPEQTYGGEQLLIEDHHDGPQQDALFSERLMQIREAFQSLTGLERAVMEADVEAGEPVEAAELAAELKVTAKSIYAARQRARTKLARQLAPYEP